MRVVLVNHIPGGTVSAVCIDEGSMVKFDLLNLFRHLELVEAGAIRVHHVLDKLQRN